MKHAIILLTLLIPITTYSQMNPFHFSTTNELKIIPSATSSPNDFDFLEGKWNVHNRKLDKRLAGSQSWNEFESVIIMRKTLNGNGNVENYYATIGGKPFEGQAVRIFSPVTKLWTIYWIDTNTLAMDQHPVVGSFENGVGRFYTTDVFDNKPITVVYQWDARDPKKPIWSQAFSLDQGKTWEWNWEMRLREF